jgi:hypothetical protein
MELGAKALESKPINMMTKILGIPLEKLGQALQGSPELLGQYGPMLQKALMAGPQELAIAHFVKAQTDPEYRKMIDQINGVAP